MYEKKKPVTFRALQGSFENFKAARSALGKLQEILISSRNVKDIHETEENFRQVQRTRGKL